MLGLFLYPSLSPKEMHITKTAGIMVVSLFALGLCVAPFAIAAPAQQNEMKTCNAEATAKGLGEGTGDERKAFMKNVSPQSPKKQRRRQRGQAQINRIR